MSDKLRAAAQAALDALESCGSEHPSDGGRQWHDERQVDRAINDLRAALAEPEQDAEPVAWMRDDSAITNDALIAEWWGEASIVTQLYIAPPRREWVGLTDEEIVALIPRTDAWNYEVGLEEAGDFARTIEAALKAKNGGSE